MLGNNSFEESLNHRENPIAIFQDAVRNGFERIRAITELYNDRSSDLPQSEIQESSLDEIKKEWLKLFHKLNHTKQEISILANVHKLTNTEPLIKQLGLIIESVYSIIQETKDHGDEYLIKPATIDLLKSLCQNEPN